MAGKINKMLNHRCIVCNKTSTPAIATNLGDETKRHFVLDEQTETGFICGDCEDWDEASRDHFRLKDEYDFLWDENFLGTETELEVENETESEYDGL